MAKAPSYKAVLKKYNSCSVQVKWYFDQLPALLPKFPYEVTLAYFFLRTEKAQNRALYCGVTKIHRVDSGVADTAVNIHHLTRDGFLKLYENIFAHPVKKATRDKIEKAEKIRDRVIHGKSVGEPEMREALVDVLEYAEALNADLKSAAGFEPFGDLRGFKGRGQPLDAAASRWLLKGIGFALA
jgi:hypothetical protein